MGNKDSRDNEFIKKEVDSKKSEDKAYFVKLYHDADSRQSEVKKDRELLDKYKLMLVREDTRNEIAKVFVYGFFLLLILTLVIIPTYNAAMFAMTGKDILFIKLIDVLTLIGTVVGTSLGFVTGFYFKSFSETEQVNYSNANQNTNTKDSEENTYSYYN